MGDLGSRVHISLKGGCIVRRPHAAARGSDARACMYGRRGVSPGRGAWLCTWGWRVGRGCVTCARSYILPTHLVITWWVWHHSGWYEHASRGSRSRPTHVWCRIGGGRPPHPSPTPPPLPPPPMLPPTPPHIACRPTGACTRGGYPRAAHDAGHLPRPGMPQKWCKVWSTTHGSRHPPNHTLCCFAGLRGVGARPRRPHRRNARAESFPTHQRWSDLAKDGGSYGGRGGGSHACRIRE